MVSIWAVKNHKENEGYFHNYGVITITYNYYLHLQTIGSKVKYYKVQLRAEDNKTTNNRNNGWPTANLSSVNNAVKKICMFYIVI